MNCRQSLKGRRSDVEKCTHHSRHMSGGWNYEVNRPCRELKLLQQAHEGSGGEIVCDVIGKRPCYTASSLGGAESTFNFTEHQPRHGNLVNARACS
jgi:hypothetical protein